MRSIRASARSPAGSATSSTSKVRPTGSITAAPGDRAQASLASSRVAPAGTRGAKSSGCAPGAGQSDRPQEQAPAAVRAPGTTSQPHSPVNSATTVHSDARPRRRVPDRKSRVPRLLPMPIVKPMPPPTVRRNGGYAADVKRDSLFPTPQCDAVQTAPGSMSGGAPERARPGMHRCTDSRLAYVK